MKKIGSIRKIRKVMRYSSYISFCLFDNFLSMKYSVSTSLILYYFTNFAFTANQILEMTQ